jgi:hypothetical protein
MSKMVVIESPYSGDVDRNIRYLNLAMADSSVLYNEAPYASHSYMTQHGRASKFFVSDYDDKWTVLSRDGAIKVSDTIRKRADLAVFYVDRGWSSGMKAAVQFYKDNGISYIERTVNRDELAKNVELYTREFCDAIIDDQPYEHLLVE